MNHYLIMLVKYKASNINICTKIENINDFLQECIINI